MAAKKQQVKKQEPVQQVEPVIAIEEQAATTIKIRPETKAKLDELKEMLKVPDYNTTVARLIELIPERLSTEQTITLVIPAGKYRWLVSHQDSCDTRRLLADSVR